MVSTSASVSPAATSSNSSKRGRVASAMPISSSRCCEGVVAPAGRSAWADKPISARMLASSRNSHGAVR